jgi:formylglycine-generating enzyme required for sulfatase activity/tRNA A-37 threonylcarbamoyl transferase component Bud32/mono/diheme cytochrome c family protein
MPLEPSTVDHFEGRLEEAILFYLKAADAGMAPSREALLARYPDLAPQLQDFLADQEQLGALVAPLRGLAPARRLAGAGADYFGDFELLEEIAAGGMGVVYKARQKSLNRIVALKMISKERSQDADARARFRDEAKFAAQFDHPNIVGVYETGEYAGRPYYTLEFISGGTLAEARKTRPWTPRAAARLVAQLADAMDYAHQKDIVHRDLKPANILLKEDGTPKITDFGLSKQLQADAAGLTCPGDRLGTPAYMSPEQAKGELKAIGPRTDVFGLGAILYDLLTGQAPFQGDTVEEVMKQAKAGQVCPPRQLRARVPAALERICLRAMEADPQKRYPSAAALGRDLRRYLARPRRAALAAGTAAAVLLTGTTAWLLAEGWLHPEGSSSPARPENLHPAPKDRGAPVPRQPEDLAQKARAILKANCYPCHGQDGNVEGGFNFVLDRKQLVSRRSMVVLGKPEKSRIFRRIRDQEMPPEDEKQRPSDSDLAILEQWINKGAPDFNPPRKERPFITSEEMLQFIRADLEKARKKDRPFLRYFTITHLYNAGLPEDGLKSYRFGLSKLVNSLSWGPAIVKPAAIDPARTIFRIDLSDYKWDTRVWRLILTRYPYGILYPTRTAQAITDATQCELPYLRADWFVFAASRPPLYHQVLQLPQTEQELEQELKVPVADNIRRGRVARAGIFRSGVAQSNRLLERHDSVYGAYWKSYDVRDNLGRRNLFTHPLGPGSGPNAFQYDGSEIIFNLPNGLQGYFLVNARGKRLDSAPPDLVSDPKQTDRLVVNGISCMSCHARGLNEKRDEIRKYVQKHPDSFRETADDIRALYKPADEFAARLKEDANRFARAVRETGARPSTTEPIVVLALRFEWELDVNLAAAEVGLKARDFLKELEESSDLERIFGGLKVEGGTVKRQVQEAAFRKLVDELKLGKWYQPKELSPPPVTNSIGMKFTLIPKGRFPMGSPNDEDGRGTDEKLHEVHITRPFYMGVYEVTQEEYEKVMKSNPSFFSAEGKGSRQVEDLDTRRFPVERVSWEDAQEFCRKLSALTAEKKAGRVYRLPTEAEWEYACRGGASKATPFHCGTRLSSKDANFEGIKQRTTEVGSFPPNGFGLYDMHGNVQEWCADWYDKDYYADSPREDPTGPTTDTNGFKVLRGGSWDEEAGHCRSAFRRGSLPSFQNGKEYGFRVVLVQRPKGS